MENRNMSKRIIAVNAGPRKGWNTDTLITEASKGAESAGATVERFDLFKLEKYTGCVSCFGCKKEKFKGQCICRDALKPVLDAIRESDGLIIGSPNYLSELTASFRCNTIIRCATRLFILPHISYRHTRKLYFETYFP